MNFFPNDWFKKFSFFILLEKHFKNISLIISNVHCMPTNLKKKNTMLGKMELQRRNDVVNADYNYETLHTVVCASQTVHEICQWFFSTLSIFH